MKGQDQFSVNEFLSWAATYVPRTVKARELGPDMEPGGQVAPADLKENTFYIFGCELSGAMCRSVEDLALETGKGKLILVTSECSEVILERDRYWELGHTLDDVRMIGRGEAPVRVKRVRWVKDAKKGCDGFYGVSFSSPKQHGIFLCKRLGKPDCRGHCRWVGFYSFEAAVVEALVAEITATAAGKRSGWPEFTRLLAIDQATKALNRDLTAQSNLMAAAASRLRQRAGGVNISKFASEFDQGLERLRAWRARLEETLGGQQQG